MVKEQKFVVIPVHSSLSIIVLYFEKINDVLIQNTRYLIATSCINIVFIITLCDLFCNIHMQNFKSPLQ